MSLKAEYPSSSIDVTRADCSRTKTCRRIVVCELGIATVGASRECRRASVGETDCDKTRAVGSSCIATDHLTYAVCFSDS